MINIGENWVGISVSGEKIVIVNLGFSSDGNVYVKDDISWKLQRGERPEAYDRMYHMVHDYLKENTISQVIIKGSAVIHGRGNASLAHLKSAELRGVIMAAAACSKVPVQISSKATVSRTFGERKTDEYVLDEEFWQEQLAETIKKGSREIAFLVLAAKKHNE